MIRYSIEKHASAFPSKVLAQNYGAHIFNIEINRDVDQGSLIARGAYKSLDLYEMAEATTFSGKVVEQAANGNYYVEVVDPGDALFVYSVPMINEEYSQKFLAEKNFFNAEGDVVRAYTLTKGDIFELSVEGFENAAAPTVGATVALSTDPDNVGKLV